MPDDGQPVIQIREAQREGARLLLGISGPTGSGKTYTAIQLAYGLANYNAKKVGFLDAENRRGSLYADILPDSFYIADLNAPFSPDRYTRAIKAFEDAKVEVLVIDSTSHEWEGLGGVTEIARSVGTIDSPRWEVAKDRHHKPFINYMLQSPLHIICCLRARETAHKEQVEEGGKKKMVWVSDGVHPIQEKNFMFEMTASLMMFDEGKRQETLKCPEALRPYLGRGNGYITAEDGKKIREWVDGAKQLDPEVERWRGLLQNTTTQGEIALEKMWTNDVPKPIQKKLGKAFIATAKSAAQAFDQKKIEASSTGNSAIDELNNLGNSAKGSSQLF